MCDNLFVSPRTFLFGFPIQMRYLQVTGYSFGDHVICGCGLTIVGLVIVILHTYSIQVRFDHWQANCSTSVKLLFYCRKLHEKDASKFHVQLAVNVDSVHDCQDLIMSTELAVSRWVCFSTTSSW